MSTRIQIKRGTTTPAGLTTGEFAYNVTNSTLYIGNTADQKWIGGEVTGGVDMGAGSAASQTRVPTQNAVYEYARQNFVHRLNGITGGITLNAGTNITITSSVAGGITIAATNDGVGALTGAANIWTATQYFAAGFSAASGVTFTGTVAANGGLTASTLDVTGLAKFNGNVTIGDNAADVLTVTSGSTFNGRADFAGLVEFASGVTFDSTVISGHAGGVTYPTTAIPAGTSIGTGISFAALSNAAFNGNVIIGPSGGQIVGGLTQAVLLVRSGTTFERPVRISTPTGSGTPFTVTGLSSLDAVIVDKGLTVSGAISPSGGINGATFNSTVDVTGVARFNGGATATTIDVVNAARFNGGATASTLDVTGAARFNGAATFNSTLSGSTASFTRLVSSSVGVSAAEIITSTVTSPLNSGLVTITTNNSQLTKQAGVRFLSDDGIGGLFYSTLRTSSLSAGQTLDLPNDSGVVALTKQLMGTVNGSTAATTAVTSFNGRTGAVQGVSAAVAGDGISVSGATGSVTITNSGVTRAVAGTGIGLNANTGTVTITNNGVQSFNGLTGAVGGVCAAQANTFTALQTFTGGISAASGITLTSPNLTGTPLATTAAVGTNTTQIATTAFVQNEIVADTVTSIDGVTGAITNVARKNIDNAFSAVQTFTAGISAAGGITFNGPITGVTATFNRRVNALQGVCVGSGFNVTTPQVITNTISPLTASGGATLTVSSPGDGGSTRLAIEYNDGVNPATYGTFVASSVLTASRNYTLPNDSGTLALTSQLMGAINGSTAATTAVTSFNGRTGAVQGVSAAVAGDGISVSGATGSVTITNTGVTRAAAGTGISVSANTGTVTITNTGVLSFNGNAGAVQGVSAAVAGDGISVSGATGAVTITNSGVTRAVAGTGISVSANTGTVTITNNGVQSFNGSTGAISGVGSIVAGTNISITPTGGTGAVTINAAGVTTTATNTFTAVQIFTSGLSAGGGVTLASPNLTGTPLATTAAVGTNTTQIATTAFVQNEIVADTVTSFNGRTGAVQGVSAAVAGDGISVSGATGSVTITNSGVTRAVAGTGIGLNANTGTVTITNNGVQSFNGLTGAVGGVCAAQANTFSALQTFTTGISADGAITFNGTLTGATATFSRLVTGNAGFSGALTGTATNASALGGTAAASWALLASPTFTGTPAAPTPAIGTNTTQIATTAFVQNEIVADTVTSFNGRTGSVQGVSAAVAGDGISVSGATGAVTITNTGVTRAVAGTGIGLNANTGTVTITNNGVQSFNGSTGAIQGVGSIVAGTNVTISPTGGTGAVTINSVGVTSTAAYTWSAAQTFNGGVTASTLDVTGLAKFNGNVTVGDAATDVLTVTSGATFGITDHSGVARFAAGVTASRIDVINDLKVVGGTEINGHVTINRGLTIGGGGGVLNALGGISGVTFTQTTDTTGVARFNGGATASTLDVTNAARFNGGATASAMNVTGVSRLNGGVTASTLDVSGTSRFAGTASFPATVGLSAGVAQVTTIQSNNIGQVKVGIPVGVLIAGTTQAGLQFLSDDGLGGNYSTTFQTTTLSANRTITLPDDSGTLALTKGTVWRLNGITGGITLNQGTNITITSSVAGGITIAASGGGGGGALTADANIWTATQYFNAGFSAAAGVTFTGTVSGSTAAFTRLLTLDQGLSAAGGTTFSGHVQGTTASFSGHVGIGAGGFTTAYRLFVNGSFAATTKSFYIDHPTQPGKKLQHGSLEGPENGVYVRGRSDSNIIYLPEYWSGLVDESTITVHLTPIGKRQDLWVAGVDIAKVIIYGSDTPSFYYTVWGERKDVPRLEVEV